MLERKVANRKVSVFCINEEGNGVEWCVRCVCYRRACMFLGEYTRHACRRAKFKHKHTHPG